VWEKMSREYSYTSKKGIEHRCRNAQVKAKRGLKKERQILKCTPLRVNLLEVENEGFIIVTPCANQLTSKAYSLHGTRLSDFNLS
jgi:hypothetical protein